MFRTDAFEAILRTPWAGPWRRFRRPSRLIVALDPQDVRDALAQVDAAVRSGHYAVGLVTYEAAAAFDLPVKASTAALPLVCFGLFSADAVETLHRFPASGVAEVGEWMPSVGHAEYLDAIAAIKQHIERGDTYQINFTFRLRAPFAGSPAALMADLYAGQTGGWSAYLDLGDLTICSASPELFVSFDGGRLECKPMKGTAPRGLWPEQDAAYGRALATSEKNRAENVMIADMVRNDLGRIATVGSVRPASLFDVERYPQQWQMTSTIVAESRRISTLGLFEAMFPSGSVTGAPKHSAMTIIRELETTPRGIYTGAIGYLSPRGRGHFSVAIRSVLVDRVAGTAELGIGSGVVWDSVDRDEYEECLLKAGPIVRGALGRRGASYAVAEPPGFRLLESILWTPDAGFALLERHLERLVASAACFNFQCDVEQVRDMLRTAVADLRGPAKVRVMVEAEGSVLVEAVDLMPVRSPLRLALADDPVDPTDVFLYHKTTRRAVYDRARTQHAEADAVVLWNQAGEVTESTDANVVVRLDGLKITPPIECGLLPGTMRAQLLARNEIAEARILKIDLARAEEIWLINSVRGWMRGTMVQP